MCPGAGGVGQGVGVEGQACGGACVDGVCGMHFALPCCLIVIITNVVYMLLDIINVHDCGASAPQCTSPRGKEWGVKGGKAHWTLPLAHYAD
jgi:hypothetical protein